MITKVTITGADDSIRPGQLIDLQNEFPFVEWGILLSRKQAGKHRFPSLDWLELLYQIRHKLNLSGHLCGAYVRELALGNNDVISGLGKYWDMFSRVQINFHGEQHDYSTKMSTLLNKYPEKEFIFQYDNVNTTIISHAATSGVNCSALFDLSHGAGVVPTIWPELIPNFKCGYAGGLSPDNLAAQIKLIEERAGNTPIWIDMETHVRSKNDTLFDLIKVRRCLEIAAEVINVETSK